MEVEFPWFGRYIFILFRMNNTLCQVTQTFRVVHNSLASVKRGAAKHSSVEYSI